MDRGDQDLVAATLRLRAALVEARGKLRVADALALAGFERRTLSRAILVGRAMRDLGWDRGRYRFNGELLYGFARGSYLEREAILDVEDGRIVVRGTP